MALTKACYIPLAFFRTLRTSTCTVPVSAPLLFITPRSISLLTHISGESGRRRGVQVLVGRQVLHVVVSEEPGQPGKKQTWYNLMHCLSGSLFPSPLAKKPYGGKRRQAAAWPPCGQSGRMGERELGGVLQEERGWRSGRCSTLRTPPECPMVGGEECGLLGS